MNKMDATSYESEKQGLMTKLLDSVKQCQIRFGGKTELATEADSRVSCLCSCWEAVLQYGLKHNNKALAAIKQVTQMTGLTKISSGISLLEDIKNMETEPTFWLYVKEHLSKHEIQRYLLLKNILTDAGRGRAWMRSALNENSLEKYMHMLIERQDLISQYYEDWSFMADEERRNILPNMAAGLGSILFAIGIDNPEFNSIKAASGLDALLSSSAPQVSYPPRAEEELTPVIAGDSSPKSHRKEKRRKKKAAHIVLLDEADTGSYSASPASSASTPKTLTFDLCTIPVVTASSSQTATIQGFKTKQSPLAETLKSKMEERLLAGHSLENGSTVKGHIRTGSCDNPLQYYSEQSKQQPSSKTTHKKAASMSFDKVEVGEILKEVRSQFDAKHPKLPHQNSYPVLSTNLDTSGWSSAQNNHILESKSSSKSSYIPKTDSRNSEEAKYKLSKSHSNDDHPPTTAAFSEKSKTVSTSMSNLCNNKSHGLDNNKTVGRNRVASMSNLGRSDSTASNTSFNSVNSDFSFQEEQMTPVLPDDINHSQSEAITIVCGNRTDESTSESFDSGEMPLYNEMAQNAAKALLLAQPPVISSDLLRTQGDGSNEPHPILPHSQDTMTTVELKQAVIAMMARKDEVEEHNKALTAALEHELGTSATLRLEIEEMRKEQRLRSDRDADKIKALARENDLLKHQLKKYVNAVQMLRRQGAKIEDFPGIHVEESPQPVIPPSVLQRDYSFEASEYEKKLVQVAEMHGELMEFNEVLQRNLLAREATIKALKEELTDLRGPLPDNGRTSDDELSLISDYPQDQPRPLINIWIPSAFLRGSGSGSHHVYQVYVRIRDEEWNVYRRYTDFYDLQTILKKRFPITATFNFPPKKAIGSKEPHLVELRRKKLQQYLRQIVNLLILGNPDLSLAASRETLCKTLPFFGDHPASDKKKKHNKKDGRQRESNSRQEAASGSSSSSLSHTYMGL